MKLFISQPMRGKTDAEIEAERSKIIEEAKRRFGDVDVIDSFFKGQDTSNPILCLSKSLEKLAGADVVWFAPGWECANGCTIEHEVAKRYLGDNHIVEADAKYIVRCELDVGACMFSSFWNGRTFEKGEENAKVFHRRESAEEELNRFGYSTRDYSILKTTEL